MFSGTFTPKLDEKGRLFLPAKFREAMKGGLVISPGQDAALEVRSQATFDAFTAGLHDSTDERLRAYNRMLFSLSHDDTPDKQGRVSIPSELREYAALDRDCVVIGVLDKLEIWNAESWTQYRRTEQQALSNLSVELFPR